MKKAILTLAATALFTIPCPAMADDLNSSQFHICMDKSQNTATDMLDCMQQEYERQDKLLNVNYKKAMAAAGKVSGKTGQNGIRDAQRAWLKWRELDLPLFQYGGAGTHSQIRAMEDYLEKTALRAKFLGDLADMMQ